MLFKLLKAKVVFLALLSCSVTAVAQDAILEKTLTSMGYRITARSSPAPADWERKDLNMESKQLFVIKSLKKVPGGENLYRRMAVTIEKYKDPADAISIDA